MEFFFIQSKKVLFSVPYESKLPLWIIINTNSAAVSEPQFLNLIPNEHLVLIQHWMSQRKNKSYKLIKI